MNIQPVIEKIKRSVKQHAIQGCPGQYCRIPDGKPNEYGCADAANILYTIGMFPRDRAERDASITALQAFQMPDNGLFQEPTHVPLHTTAHCIAALELFDASPVCPLTALDAYKTPDGITELLNSLAWNGVPRLQGHEGAGAFAALMLTGHYNRQWKNAYFNWLKNHCDPKWGFGLKNMVGNPVEPAYHLFDWFHYLFNFHAANQPFPYPEKLIDSCLELFENNALADRFNAGCGFFEIDWTFCLNRACRQTGYRFHDCRSALERHKTLFIDMLMSCDELNDLPCGKDLHMVFGTVCALAELQLALPGELETDVTLKNVLDRRAFV